MPKYAVLSDIHGNLEALEAVLQVCSAMGVEKFIVLGDIVGYNADPAKCIEIIRNLNPAAVVRGNHDDYAISSNMENSGFNINAQIAIQWTHDHLSEEDREWLSKLPYKAVIPECNATAVHATLDSPEGWGYIFDVQHAAAHFTYQIKPVCFCGHSCISLPSAARTETEYRSSNALSSIGPRYRRHLLTILASFSRSPSSSACS